MDHVWKQDESTATPGTTAPCSPAESVFQGISGLMEEQGPRKLVVTTDWKLADVANSMLTSGQTEGVVVDSQSRFLDIITERNILRAYLHGAPWDCTVAEWLRGRISPAPPIAPGKEIVFTSDAWTPPPSPAGQPQSTDSGALPGLPAAGTIQQLLQALLLDEKVPSASRELLWAFEQKISCTSSISLLRRPLSPGTELKATTRTTKQDMETTLRPQEVPRAEAEAAEHKAPNKMPRPMTVGDIALRRSTPIVSIEASLGDACEELLTTHRTAAVVMEKIERPYGGSSTTVVQGVLTENDILEAYVCGFSRDKSVRTWLRGGDCRLPGFMLPTLTVEASASVAEAANCMASMAQGGDLSFACHHLLVRGDSATPRGVSKGVSSEKDLLLLSALDLVVGMLKASEAEEAAKDAGGIAEAGAAAVAAAEVLVSQAMKLRSLVPVCPLNLHLSQAFQRLRSSFQNCAFVVEERDVRKVSEAKLNTGDKKVFSRGEHELPSSSEFHSTQSFEDVCSSSSEELAEPIDDWSKGETLPEDAKVCGIITTADAVKAFSEGCETSSRLLHWMTSQPPIQAERFIRSDARLRDAAKVMERSGLHHLLVVEPGGMQVVGVLSALDVVCTMSGTYRDAHPAVEQWGMTSRRLLL